MKAIKVIAVAAGALLLLSACSTDGSQPGASESAGESILVGYSSPISSNPTVKAVEDSMRAKLAELDGELIIVDAQLDVSKQFADIQSLISRDVDVIVIWPVDPLGVQPALDQAREKGIPVIVQETAEGGPYASNFLVTNFEAAKSAAQLIEDAVGPNAKVAQILGLPAIGELNSRNTGFEEGAAERGQEILAAQINEIDSADGARPIVDAWRTRFGSDIQAIFAYNDPSALGAASAKSPEFDPVIVGFNGSEEGVAAVRDGRLLATFDQHPVLMGAGLGWAAVHVVRGGKLPETVVLEATPITADNVEDWESTSDLLEKTFDVSIDEGSDPAVLVVTPRR